MYIVYKDISVVEAEIRLVGLSKFLNRLHFKQKFFIRFAITI